ncbi:hypothetical protein Tco_1243394, partial [Tanacetum coccineum]
YKKAASRMIKTTTTSPKETPSKKKFAPAKKDVSSKKRSRRQSAGVRIRDTPGKEERTAAKDAQPRMHDHRSRYYVFMAANVIMMMIIEAARFVAVIMIRELNFVRDWFP